MAYPPLIIFGFRWLDHLFIDLSAKSTRVAMNNGQELILVISLRGTCHLCTFNFLHQLFNLSAISKNFPISRNVVRKLLSLALFAGFSLDNSRSLLNQFGCRKLCLNPFFSLKFQTRLEKRDEKIL